MWRDFHEFWTNAKIPVHIIRYEDIVSDPLPTLKSVLEFILNVPDITGTKVEHFLNIAVEEESPQIYQPRQGKINANFDKFNQEQLDFITDYAHKFIKMFDYYDLYLKMGAVPIKDPIVDKEIPNGLEFIRNFNLNSLKHSMYLQNECEEVTSIYINYPALLLRKKSEMYPNGRTSHRFKNYLRRKVTIVDKNKKAVDQSEVQD